MNAAAARCSSQGSRRATADPPVMPVGYNERSSFAADDHGDHKTIMEDCKW